MRKSKETLKQLKDDVKQSAVLIVKKGISDFSDPFLIIHNHYGKSMKITL